MNHNLDIPQEFIDSIKTPEQLLSWMKTNIEYDENNTVLKSPEEVFYSKKGNCHDQVQFEEYIFKKINFNYGKLFFIEYNDTDSHGGMTHTLLYYYLPRGGSRLYWFENSWDGKQGIHGPFKDLSELKNLIIQEHRKMPSFDKYPKLEFAKCPNQKQGTNLNKYVQNCLSESFFLESNISNTRLYHLSQSNLDNKLIHPSIPNNFMTKNGYENNKIPRISFAKTIDGCLRGLSQRCVNMELYVHIPIIDKNTKIKYITNSDVPDASITGEVWIISSVKFKCIGKIKVLKDKGEKGIPYKYGDNTAELYDWEWNWMEKYNSALSESMSNFLQEINILQENINSFKKIETTEENINRLEKIYPRLNHVRTGDNLKGIILLDKENFVGVLQCDIEKKFIVALEVNTDYRNQGIASYLLDEAKRLGVYRLSVNKNNINAINLYKKKGYRTYKKTETMLFMSTKKYIATKKSSKKLYNKSNYIEESSIISKSLLSAKFNINTPEDLSNWMKTNIKYGYLCKNGNIKENLNKYEFFFNFKLQNPNEVLENKIGVCWDQTEFQRDALTSMKIKNKVFCIILSIFPVNPIHTFSVFWKDKKLYWFENALRDFKGIKGPYNTLQNLTKDVYDAMFLEFGSNKGFKIHELKKPKYGINCLEFLKFADKEREVINQNGIVDNIGINESGAIISNELTVDNILDESVSNMKQKRKQIEEIIYKVMDSLDHTGLNTKKYKDSLEKLSDIQFETFMKNFLKDDNANFNLEILPFKNEPSLEEIKKAADILGVPLEEYVYYRYGEDKDDPVRSAFPVPVGYLSMKRLQQILFKKNTYTMDIDSRNARTGQVTGDSRIAQISDAETYALTAVGADKALQEFLGARADNISAKREMYQNISTQGYVQLNNLKSVPEDSQTISTIDVFLTGAGITTDLITNNLALSRTIKNM